VRSHARAVELTAHYRDEWLWNPLHQARAAQAAEDAGRQQALWKARGEQLRQSRVHVTPDGKLRIDGVQLEGLSEEGSSEEEGGEERAKIADMKMLQVRVKTSL
jgi:multidrug efflux pump subunit AcrA (membrane-fusion protein)